MPVLQMTEEDCFLKAIADEPGDQTARLVYADWLDDRGEKPWLTEQIRKGYESIAVERWGVESHDIMLGWYGAHDRKSVPRGTGTWLDRALKPFDVVMHNNGLWMLQFRGGFLDTVETDVHSFFENAHLFGKHPVRGVRLTDFRPKPQKFRADKPGATQWIVYVHNIGLQHDRAAPSTEYTYLPPEFKTLLKGDVYEPAYGDRQYRTEKDARADVAQACAAYSRAYYGWKSHGK